MNLGERMGVLKHRERYTFDEVMSPLKEKLKSPRPLPKWSDQTFNDLNIINKVKGDKKMETKNKINSIIGGFNEVSFGDKIGMYTGNASAKNATSNFKDKVNMFTSVPKSKMDVASKIKGYLGSGKADVNPQAKVKQFMGGFNTSMNKTSDMTKKLKTFGVGGMGNNRNMMRNKTGVPNLNVINKLKTFGGINIGNKLNVGVGNTRQTIKNKTMAPNLDIRSKLNTFGSIGGVARNKVGSPIDRVKQIIGGTRTRGTSGSVDFHAKVMNNLNLNNKWSVVGGKEGRNRIRDQNKLKGTFMERMFGDADKDGVRNIIDCEPLNWFKDGFTGDAAEETAEQAKKDLEEEEYKDITKPSERLLAEKIGEEESTDKETGKELALEQAGGMFSGGELSELDPAEIAIAEQIGREEQEVAKKPDIAQYNLDEEEPGRLKKAWEWTKKGAITKGKAAGAFVEGVASDWAGVAADTITGERYRKAKLRKKYDEKPWLDPRVRSLEGTQITALGHLMGAKEQLKEKKAKARAGEAKARSDYYKYTGQPLYPGGPGGKFDAATDRLNLNVIRGEFQGRGGGLASAIGGSTGQNLQANIRSFTGRGFGGGMLSTSSNIDEQAKIARLTGNTALAERLMGQVQEPQQPMAPQPVYQQPVQQAPQQSYQQPQQVGPSYSSGETMNIEGVDYIKQPGGLWLNTKTGKTVRYPRGIYTKRLQSQVSYPQQQEMGY